MTKFPQRPKKDIKNDDVWQRILNTEHDVCDCGHADFAHEILPEELRKDKYVIEFGECEKCLCPRLDPQHKATYRTILNSHRKTST